LSFPTRRSSDLAIGGSERLFIIPVGLQVSNVDCQNCIVVGPSPSCFNRRLEILHDLAKLRYQISPTYDFAVGIERCLPGNVNNFSTRNLGHMSVADWRLQALGVQ